MNKTFTQKLEKIFFKYFPEEVYRKTNHPNASGAISEIKQLIKDEIIGEDEPDNMNPSDFPELGNDTEYVRNNLRSEQRKKLENSKLVEYVWEKFGLLLDCKKNMSILSNINGKYPENPNVIFICYSLRDALGLPYMYISLNHGQLSEMMTDKKSSFDSLMTHFQKQLKSKEKLEVGE